MCHISFFKILAKILKYDLWYWLAGIIGLHSAEPYYRSDDSGQQACYGANGELLSFDQGGGTVDRYHHTYGLKHFAHDVLPYLECCKLSSLCSIYRANRPTQDCTGYTPPRPGNTDCSIINVILFVHYSNVNISWYP